MSNITHYGYTPEQIKGMAAEVERLTAGNAAVDAQFRIWRERAERAEAEIERLRAALTEYAKDKNWKMR